MRYNCLNGLIFLAVVMPIPAAARPVQTEFISVTYKCERDMELTVVFVNDTQGRSNAIILIDGKLLQLSQVVSASGARYRDEDESAVSYELWNKGNKAAILYGTAEESEIIFKDCAEIPEEKPPEKT